MWKGPRVRTRSSLSVRVEAVFRRSVAWQQVKPASAGCFAFQASEKSAAMIDPYVAVADGMPVITVDPLFKTYGVDLPPVARAYSDAVFALRGVRDWVEGALRETEFVAEDEP